MEFKGTKGEWTMETNFLGETNHPTKIISKSADRTICVPRVNNLGECIANMRLIAEAPELLKQAIVILKKLQSKTESVNGLDQINLEKAIAKALNK